MGKAIQKHSSSIEIVSPIMSVFLQTFCNIKHLAIVSNIKSCRASIILHVCIDSIEIDQHGNNVKSAAGGGPEKSSATKWTSNVNINVIANQRFNDIPVAATTRKVKGCVALEVLYIHIHLLMLRQCTNNIPMAFHARQHQGSMPIFIICIHIHLVALSHFVNHIQTSFYAYRHQG
jgi:hypothetical protein